MIAARYARSSSDQPLRDVVIGLIRAGDRCMTLDCDSRLLPCLVGTTNQS